MKKLLSLILLVILLWPGYSQAQEKIYLPLIFKTGAPTVDNKWRIITPVASSNYCLNPSGEIAGNFSDVSGATTTRVTTYQKYGLYSYQVAAPAIGDGVSLTTSALTNVEHFVTVRVRGNANLLATIGSATKRLKFIEKIDDSWSLYGAPFAAAQVSTETALEITAAQPGTFYLDGVQAEPLSYWTTYIDGTQDGCEWLGAQHASISQRSALSKAGGKSVDFWEGYKFQVERVVGAGSAPRRLGVDSYAILPGGELNSEKIEPREFTIIGQFIADTEAELHEKTQELESAFFADDRQLTRIRFNGAKVQKEIAARYGGGLEGDMPVIYNDDRSIEDGNWLKLNKFSQRVAIQLTAPNPFWLEVGESAIALDAEDSGTFTIIAGRLKDTGRWNNLGPPDAAGSYTETNDLEWDIAGSDLYIGGEFANFDNIAAADYIVKYNPNTNTYSALAGTSLTERVHALKFLADGTLILGGRFNNAGGDADADYIAQHNGVEFSAISATVLNNFVYALALAPDGKLYIGGEFTNVGADANADYVVYWDGTNFNTMGATPLNGIVRAIAVDRFGTVYIGGDFTNAGGDANADYICKWDGTSFSALTSTPLNGIVRAIDIANDGTVYIGGDFTNAGGDANADYICQYNGSEFFSLGAGVDDDVYAIGIGYDGVVWISGGFDTAGGVAAKRNAKWNGSTWTPLEIFSASAVISRAIEFGRRDAVLPSNYDVFWGFDDAGVTITYAGGATANNNGSVSSFPVIFIKRSGGTSSILKFIRNETKQKALNFDDYALLDGETLTINLNQKIQNIASDVFGNRPDAILQNSNMGTFSLDPGNNTITMLVDNDGATITAYMLWRDAYSSY